MRILSEFRFFRWLAAKEKSKRRALPIHFPPSRHRVRTATPSYRTYMWVRDERTGRMRHCRMRRCRMRPCTGCVRAKVVTVVVIRTAVTGSVVAKRSFVRSGRTTVISAFITPHVRSTPVRARIHIRELEKLHLHRVVKRSVVTSGNLSTISLHRYDRDTCSSLKLSNFGIYIYI